MKELVLNYAPSQLLDKRVANWEKQLIEDWDALYSAHSEDVVLIERLEHYLIVIKEHEKATMGMLGMDDLNDALSAITAWRGEK